MIAIVILVLVIQSVVSVITTGQNDYCQDMCSKNGSGPLSFTGSYQEKHLVRVGDGFNLDCCSGDLSTANTTWYQWNQGWRKIPVASDPDNQRYPCENNQILMFHDADKIGDTGSYYCEASDGSVTIRRNFTVYILDCVKNKPDYLKIVRQPDTELQAKVGQAFHQTCEVNFECLEAAKPDSHVWWSYRGADGIIHNVTALGHGGHYQAHETVSEDNTSKSVSLTIYKVFPEDLTTTFTCTATKGSNFKMFSFTLTQPANDKILSAWQIIIIAASVGVGLAITLTVAVTWLLWGPTIKYKQKLWFSKLPKHNGRRFDVMVLLREEAEDNARQIAEIVRDRLKEKRYKVYTPNPAECLINDHNNITNCVTVIFVIEQGNSEHERALAIVSEWHCNAIFITLCSCGHEDWDRLSPEYARFFERVPDLYKVLQWPGGNADGFNRKCINFWNEIQSLLPKPEVQNNQPARDSDCPLLDAQNSNCV